MYTMQAKQLLDEIRKLREFLEEKADLFVVGLSKVS